MCTLRRDRCDKCGRLSIRVVSMHAEYERLFFSAEITAERRARSQCTSNRSASLPALGLGRPQADYYRRVSGLARNIAAGTMSAPQIDEHTCPGTVPRRLRRRGGSCSFSIYTYIFIYIYICIYTCAAVLRRPSPRMPGSPRAKYFQSHSGAVDAPPALARLHRVSHSVRDNILCRPRKREAPPAYGRRSTVPRYRSEMRCSVTSFDGHRITELDEIAAGATEVSSVRSQFTWLIEIHKACRRDLASSTLKCRQQESTGEPTHRYFFSRR
ncbi:unnamed protein product [Rangifer tarandus platyrhynchus]|uniref:Uncharacterized protein n=1 Tax=Rangifer tarandus platyrhynchus TaxID=3082113 RepID=A0ABN8XIV9_RANTA|nr:unnamed protein product [Rangifer tarandus platyrhynchus]